MIAHFVVRRRLAVQTNGEYVDTSAQGVEHAIGKEETVGGDRGDHSKAVGVV
jgi:hypothetical protein